MLHWSPDGKQIVFQLNSGDEAEIHSIDSNGGSARKLVSGQGPGLSRDGRWIYLMHLGNDGVPQ